MPHPTGATPSLPASLAIRLAVEADAEAIAPLGARLFAQAYGPTHPDPELSEYLARAFRTDAVADGVRNNRVAVFLVEEAGIGPVGYAQLSPGTPLSVPGWLGRTGCEIQRFYLDQAWQGRGVARALMDTCFRRAAEAGAEVIWLQVWQEAHWAIRFYERAGFVVVGDTPFAWGSRVETDWLMARTLPLEYPT